LSLAGTPYVEMVAVMAKYNLFAEDAGMQKIAEQPPAKEAIAIAEILQKLGFNIQLLGSRNYVLKKLQLMPRKHLTLLRNAEERLHRHLPKDGSRRAAKIQSKSSKPWAKRILNRLAVRTVPTMYRGPSQTR